MGQVTEETIHQFSASIEQDAHQVLSWQQMVAALQLAHNVEAYNTQLSSDPPAQDHVGLTIGSLVSHSETQETPSVTDPSSLGLQLKVGLQIGLSSHSNNQITRIFDFTLGKNRSNTIYRLRFLAFFNFVFYVIAGVPYLIEFLTGVHVTADLVVFIITVGAPIVVAVISVLVSYWPVSDIGSDERTNWITGLLVANIFTFGGRLAFNSVPTQRTGN